MTTMDFVKGVGVGIIAGGTIGLALTSDKRRTKKIKGRAIRTIGTVMENVADVFNV